MLNMCSKIVYNLFTQGWVLRRKTPLVVHKMYTTKKFDVQNSMLCATYQTPNQPSCSTINQHLQQISIVNFPHYPQSLLLPTQVYKGV